MVLRTNARWAQDAKARHKGRRQRLRHHWVWISIMQPPQVGRAPERGNASTRAPAAACGCEDVAPRADLRTPRCRPRHRAGGDAAGAGAPPPRARRPVDDDPLPQRLTIGRSIITKSSPTDWREANHQPWIGGKPITSLG
eukprot:gene12248-biopygen4329